MYQEAKINVQKLIKNEKRDFYHRKLRENLGKPNELWKDLKFVGLQSKVTPVYQVSLKDGETISFDENTNNNSVKSFNANLALNLVNKLPHTPNNFDLGPVIAYYKRFRNTENKNFLPTWEDEILNLPKDTNPEKAAGIENLHVQLPCQYGNYVMFQ